MKCAGNDQRHGSETSLLSGSMNAVARAFRTADDDLPRRIKIRRNEHFAVAAFCAEIVNRGLIGAENRDRALIRLRYRRMNRLNSLPNHGEREDLPQEISLKGFQSGLFQRTAEDPAAIVEGIQPASSGRVGGTVPQTGLDQPKP